MKKLVLAALLLMAAPGSVLGGEGASDAGKIDGAQIYTERCAACHDQGVGRAPPKYVLSIYRTPEFIAKTLSRGVMRPQAEGLSEAEIAAVATAITGKAIGASGEADPQANLCRSPAPPVAIGAGDWPVWSRDLTGSRFQPDPGFTAAEVPRLKLKWAFNLPGGATTGMPLAAGGRIFMPSRAGVVFALDAATGCTRWAADVGTALKSALAIGDVPGQGVVVFAGDERGTMHALDANTGRELWAQVVHDHPATRLTGAPAYHAGRLYVPVASMEESGAADPNYECCTFQGVLVAMDAATGNTVWKAPIIREPVRPTGTSSVGTRQFGPAGGGIWSSPTIDTKRGLLYVGTGDGYTDVNSDSTNALIAFELATGKRRWTRQVLEGDNWLFGCEEGMSHPNCPKQLGPDHDFGSSPILHTGADGRQVLVAGAKSGTVHAVDPDTGKDLWHARLSKGGAYGGIEWGIATDGKAVFAPISDVSPVQLERDKGGGLFALRPEDGARLWQTPAGTADCEGAPRGCSRGQPSAASAMPGVVFSGVWDGRIRAYDTTSGAVLWEFRARRDFPAVNGGIAHGGGIEMGGQIVAGGTLVVNAGTSFALPGNALLAFTVDGR